MVELYLFALSLSLSFSLSLSLCGRLIIHFSVYVFQSPYSFCLAKREESFLFSPSRSSKETVFLSIERRLFLDVSAEKKATKICSISLCKGNRIDKRMTLWNLVSPTPADNSINFLSLELSFSLPISKLIIAIIGESVWEWEEDYHWFDLITSPSKKEKERGKADLSCPIWPYLHEIMQRSNLFFVFALSAIGI